MIDVTLYAHCGMPVPLLRAEREDVRAFVKAYLKRARRDGYLTSKIEPNTWEISGPDSAWMVSDREGLLCVRRDK